MGKNVLKAQRQAVEPFRQTVALFEAKITKMLKSSKIATAIFEEEIIHLHS